MMDFQITLSEKQGQKIVDILERALYILEYNLPTPSNDGVRLSMSSGDSYRPKPGKVSQVSTEYANKAEDVTNRYINAYGRLPNDYELMKDIEEWEQSGYMEEG